MSAVIKVDNVSMLFNQSSEKIDSIKEYIIKVFKKQIHFQEFWALKNVSFELEKGDSLGIIGLNGSGKSTLLKIVSGILKPTKGTVSTYGSIAPLIELGAGFDPNLTARENIYLNGAILGYSREYMSSRFDEIIKFAELENFVDSAIKNFSSGMVARLGFAIAIDVEPQILLMMLRAPAQQTGFPPKVEPWSPKPKTLSTFSESRAAPIGKPPPSPFAVVTTSGFIS